MPVDQRQLALRVLHDAPVVILVLDLEGRIEHVNPFFERLTGHRLDDVRGKDWFAAFVPERDRDRIRALFEKSRAGEHVRGNVNPIVTHTGEERQIEWTDELLRDEEGRATGILAIGHDVTERLATLKSQTRLLELVFQHSLDNIVILDKDYNFVRVSHSYARGCQMEIADLIGKNHFEVFPSSFEQEFAPFRQAKQTYRRAERPFVYADHPERGTTYWDIAMVPILDAAGEIELFLFTLKDVSEQVRAQEQIASSLREKETLLREIHHRVKNNLQVIASLLHFQARKFSAPEGVAAFSELRQRIFAMSLVHERLYQSSDTARIDFGEYVRALVAELVRSFGPRGGVRIDVTADDVRLPVERALPSGMIVCELVMNVMKYAFPEGRDGSATVSVRSEEGRVVLAVDDDGVGFPEGFDPRTGSTFGWELVRRLVLQLDGTLTASSERGAHVRVSFSPSS